MFLRPQDHLIVYNVNEFVPMFGFRLVGMQEAELRRLREATGIAVALELTYWHTAEKAQGVYDWSTIDQQVSRCVNAGMRLILCAPIGVPHCLPASWYAQTQDGASYGQILSFWNPEAEAHTQRYLAALVQRYGGTDVTVIHHGFLGGEQYLWNAPVYHDAAAQASYQAWYGSNARIPSMLTGYKLQPEVKDWLQAGIVQHQLNMQAVLVGQHQEVWDATQFLVSLQSEANGNYARAAVLAAYRDQWPDTTRWLLQYTYWGNTMCGNTQVVDGLLNDYDCQTIVEANYCEGLLGPPTNPVPSPLLALQGGFDKLYPERWRGQVISPLHPLRGHKELEPWMLDAMKWTVDTWREARDVPQAD